MEIQKSCLFSKQRNWRNALSVKTTADDTDCNAADSKVAEVTSSIAVGTAIAGSPRTDRYVFVTERKGPLTDSAVRKMIARAGRNADFGFPIHPHMLRHATGYKLANDGHDTRAIQQYLGHKNIQHTVRYTELASNRFECFWKD